MDEGFDKAIQIANFRHDLIAVRVTDKHETEIPDIGLVRMLDSETGQKVWIDTSSAKARSHLANHTKARRAELDMLLSRNGVDQVKVFTGDDYVKPLINLFKKREARR